MLIILITLSLHSSALYAEPKNTAELALTELNLEVAAAEDRGDRKWLENVLAPEMSFRRASGAIVGRAQFLDDVKSRAPSKTRIESIHFYGKDRAVVTCIVTLKVNGQDTDFHNVRLFIRDGANWKILGWANERSNNE
jgi:hypothetical protein